MSQRILKGFTIIELMIVVAVIAVMAAIALPAYRDYSIRTKVAELVLAASGYKGAVSEAAQSGGSLASAGVGLTVAITGKITGGSVTDNGIITVNGSAATLGAAVTIVFTPSPTPQGGLTWVCSTDPTTFQYVPPSCRN